MTGMEFKNTLKNGGRLYGSAIISPSSHWAGAVRQTGIDFVFLDTEHITLGRETLSAMCRLYAALGLPPIVRIPSPDPYQACTVLDGGAVGILAPYIESVEQVKELVGAVKLRPLKGKKLRAIRDGREEMPSDLKAYVAQRNENAILFINIESVPALENLEALVSVPGLDGVIIGPHDLSCSLGLPEDYRHDEFKKAVKRIIAVTRHAGLAVGIHLSETPDMQIEWAKAGMNIILHSSDIAIFSKALRHDIEAIKTALGETTDDNFMRQDVI